ncbi:protein of unknown function [Hyphomicrobium sp. MC1]|nr:protein of unknown function [Hyphomicrobium sp. MC1]
MFTPEKHGKRAKIHGMGAVDHVKRPIPWAFRRFAAEAKTRNRGWWSTDASTGITVTVRRRLRPAQGMFEDVEIGSVRGRAVTG